MAEHNGLEEKHKEKDLIRKCNDISIDSIIFFIILTHLFLDMNYKIYFVLL